MIDLFKKTSLHFRGRIPRGAQNTLALALAHFIAFSLIYWIAFAVRLDFDRAEMTEFAGTIQNTLPILLAVKLTVFYFLGHFHGWWFYATIRDLLSLFVAAVASLILILTFNYMLGDRVGGVPRSVPLIDATLTILFLGGIRASWRVIREELLPMIQQGDYRSAVLVGTDNDTARLAHDMHSIPEFDCRIKGFLSCDGSRTGARLGQIPVLGSLDDIEKIAASRGISEVFVLAGSLPGSKMRDLMDRCRKIELPLSVIPQAPSRVQGQKTIPLRPIDINDLLQREPIQLDTQVINELVRGKRVMVTGAGGSIGSEICRQVIRFEPETLVLLGRGENRIFFLERELKQLGHPTKLIPRIADVVNEKRVSSIMDEQRPEVVFHAAAHKHVPLMEQNVTEAVRNNILGTKNVADLCDEFDVKTFVLVSTDKAVHPTSIMGTSKHMAERYVNAISKGSSTRFVVTRFGNVLGSAGSVVPIFQKQIANGGPITVTDMKMTRYFMTIPEASQLVLQAAAMGQGGEIFVLDMGEPVKIVDLAKDLIRLAGLPEDAIEINESGIRPGEKLYEELYFDGEENVSTAHPKLRAARHRTYSLEFVREQIAELASMLDEPNSVLRRKLKEFVPEYVPDFTADAPQRPSKERAK
jgi:FlaA1/EpsC-like NDP-sugar epimerase